VADPLTTPPPPERFSKEHRRQERVRQARLARLPGPFSRYADRGRRQAALVALLQVLFVIGVTLPAVRLASGHWLPTYAGVAVLAVAVVLQQVNRTVNRRAERR